MQFFFRVVLPIHICRSLPPLPFHISYIGICFPFSVLYNQNISLFSPFSRISSFQQPRLFFFFFLSLSSLVLTPISLLFFHGNSSFTKICRRIRIKPSNGDEFLEREKFERGGEGKGGRKERGKKEGEERGLAEKNQLTVSHLNGREGQSIVLIGSPLFPLSLFFFSYSSWVYL